MKHSIISTSEGDDRKTTKIPNSAELPTKSATIHQTSFSTADRKGRSEQHRHILLLKSQHLRKII
jgi:hypothetical protein